MSEYIMECKSLSKCFGSKKVLNELSFNIPKGSIFGLLGINGAGKTTLIKCLSGLFRPTSGQVTVLGDNPWNFKEKTKEKLGVCSSVRPNLSLVNGTPVN